MWKKKLHEEQWQKSHFQIRSWKRRDSRRKFSEFLGAGASLAPRLCQRIPLGSVNDWKGSSFLQVQQLTDAQDSTRSIATSGQDRARTGWSSHMTNLRSHFVIRPRRALEWLRARFFRAVFLANEGELTGKTFTTSHNTTNPNIYVKFIFLRTSPLMKKRLGSYFDQKSTFGPTFMT